MQEIATYPLDGSYRMLPSSQWSTSMGTTRDIHYNGKLRFRGDTQRRSYCSGLIFEVYLAASERALGTPDFEFPNVPEQYFARFRRDFYGYDGQEETHVKALVDRKLGVRIDSLAEARPGDLLQFWRNNGTGHSVVFLEHEGDRRPEIRYWSVQKGRLGIDREVIGSEPAQIDAGRIFIVRCRVPR
ncbi:MAG: hypothetical protein KF858_03905 [Candidatus Sumerlaeia bacterium]|nr:hypothetical protein [Candidatus Sumerlaeia bacterium]